MTFKEKIQELRKGASEAQSASKVIDRLKALKDSNNPDTSYRSDTGTRLTLLVFLYGPKVRKDFYVDNPV